MIRFAPSPALHAWVAALRAAAVGLVLFTGLLVSIGELFAQQRPVKAPEMDPLLVSRLAKTGDLTLRGTSLSDALFTISDVWQINLVVGDEIQGQVNGTFTAAPLSEVLDAILLSNGYSYRPVGRSLVVMKLEELGDMNPLFQTAAITLANSSPEDLIESASSLSSPQGKVKSIPVAHTLLVIDFPDRVAMIRHFVEEIDAAAGRRLSSATNLDGQHETAYFAPQFIPAAALKDAVQSLLSTEGKVAVIEAENRLVVTDESGRVRIVRRVIDELDMPRAQVRITALIYDISVEDMERLGINWGSAVKARHDTDGNARSLFAIDSLLTAPLTSGTVNGAMTFMNLSRHFDLVAVAEALQEANDSRLLADPSVTVIDNEKAMISIVAEIPYQQLTQTQQGGNIGTTAFKEAGVKLNVTPHIATDGTIGLEVWPIFSRLAGYTPGTTPQPIIDKREAQTVVRVANGQVLVIGGLRQRSDLGSYSGVPYLQDIKVLGNLFRSRNTRMRESELVVFIMPELVVPFDCGHPRDQAALGHAQHQLDQIPPAEGPHTESNFESRGTGPAAHPETLGPPSSDGLGQPLDNVLRHELPAPGRRPDSATKNRGSTLRFVDPDARHASRQPARSPKPALRQANRPAPPWYNPRTWFR